MINNRLFKKINSIFWGILSFLPVITLLLVCFKTSLAGTIDDYVGLYDGVFSAIVESASANNDYLFNPLNNLLISAFDSIFNYSFSGTVFGYVVECGAWFCSVQVVRLLVYVFYWFIDLISGLFDYLSFNRKGDN